MLLPLFIIHGYANTESKKKYFSQCAAFRIPFKNFKALRNPPICSNTTFQPFHLRRGKLFIAHFNKILKPRLSLFSIQKNLKHLKKIPTSEIILGLKIFHAPLFNISEIPPFLWKPPPQRRLKLKILSGKIRIRAHKSAHSRKTCRPNLQYQRRLS